jgi:hypothetical protein
MPAHSMLYMHRALQALCTFAVPCKQSEIWSEGTPVRAGVYAEHSMECYTLESILQDPTQEAHPSLWQCLVWLYPSLQGTFTAG